MTRRTKRGSLALACAVLLVAVVATPALAEYKQWAYSVGPIYAGNFIRDGDYHGTIGHLDGNSTGTAYAGVYVVNSGGGRVSAAAYCNSPGCYANINWYGPYPSGFAAVHNHGNASPSYFDAAVTYY